MDFNRDVRVTKHIHDFLKALGSFKIECNKLFEGNTSDSKGIPFVAKKMQEAMKAVEHINGPRTNMFKRTLDAMFEFDKREIMQDEARNPWPGNAYFRRYACRYFSFIFIYLKTKTCFT